MGIFSFSCQSVTSFLSVKVIIIGALGYTLFGDRGDQLMDMSRCRDIQVEDLGMVFWDNRSEIIKNSSL
jgi:hypothetical protein